MSPTAACGSFEPVLAAQCCVCCSLQTDVDRVRESYLRNLENLKRETGVAPDDDTAFDSETRARCSR